MKLKKAALGLTVLVFMVLMVPLALGQCEPPPCPPPPCEPGLSPGFWKHEVRAHLEGRGAQHFSTADMLGFVDYIDFYYFGDTNTFTLEWAYVRLWDNAYKSMWLQIANWFNEAAGLAPYSD